MEENRTRQAPGILSIAKFLTDLDVLLDTVAAAAPDALVRVKDIPIRWDAVPHLYPHISRSLTPDGSGASSSARLLGSQRSPTRPTT